MNFQFLAIVRNGPDTGIYRLVLEGELKDEMVRTFTIPAGKWQDAEILKTPFDPDYALTDNEIFEIKHYKMPPDLLNAIRFPQEYGEFEVDAHGLTNLKAIAMVGTEESRVTAVFKAIGKAKKLVPVKNLSLLCARKGYAKLTEPGIIVDDKIVALFDDDMLYFKSPSSVKQILSLKDYMKEANDLEISNFLESKFETNPEKVLAVTDSWMRKRFAALMQSNLFEEKSAVDIHEAARDFSTEIPMTLSKDRSKLVMPEAKQDIRMILKFLNEEYYKGVLTGKDFQTHAKRPLEKPENASRQGSRRGLSFKS